MAWIKCPTVYKQIRASNLTNVLCLHCESFHKNNNNNQCPLKQSKKQTDGVDTFNVKKEKNSKIEIK